MTTKIITFVIIVCFAKLYSQSHHKIRQLVDILKLANNFFNKQNEDAQRVVNSLFEMLNLTEKIFQKTNIKLLLTMHHDLDNIMKKKFEMFDVLEKVNIVANHSAKVIKLDEIVIEILREKKFNVYLYNKYKMHKNKTIKNIQRTRKRLQEFDNSKEFKQFVGGFIRKVKNLTIDDLFEQPERESSSEWYHSPEIDLKIWEPPVAQIVDLYNNATDSRRLYGGKMTNIAAFPFIVSIHVQNKFTCSGSLIKRNLAITAASCLQPRVQKISNLIDTRSMYVRLGSAWTSQHGELVPVLEIYLCPHFDAHTLNNNLAIVRFEINWERYKQRNNTEPTRILIDHGYRNLTYNTEIGLIGWGTRRPNPIVTQFEKLIYATLITQNISKCKDLYAKHHNVTRTNFCAGFTTNKTGACNRDVGGPGFIGNLLVGVISFGSPVCDDSNMPVVFTRISDYAGWIEYIITLRHQKFEWLKPKSPRHKMRAFNISHPARNKTVRKVRKNFRKNNGQHTMSTFDTQEYTDQSMDFSESGSNTDTTQCRSDENNLKMESEQILTGGLGSKTDFNNGPDRYSTSRGFWSEFLSAPDSKSGMSEGLTIQVK